jgi:glycosyltransferase involved in cell wall biosynthesis
MEIDFINGRKTDDVFGISKYSSELRNRLESVSINTIEYPVLLKGHLADGLTKRFLYPAIIRRRMKTGNIKHITNQDLAFLLALFSIHPSIVSCHDLIPWTYYHNRSILWQMNMKGLKKADCIITGSDFSKKQIIEFARVPKERIHVIPDGVDHTRFFPKHDRSILTQHGITSHEKVILYVGSEEPRKNLLFLLKSFKQLKKKIPAIRLIKVGPPGLGNSRDNTLKQIRALGIQDDVIFTGFVPEAELPAYYNAADLFVFPSLIEGFGLPPLEAMACGCPVIVANTSSLPEVVGEGGILVNPDDNDALTESMGKVLIDNRFMQEMVEKAIKRSQIFTWDRTAEATLRVYTDLIPSWIKMEYS